MQLPHSLVFVLSLFAAAQALPTPPRPRDINLSHKSLATGTTTTHSIDASLLPAELAAAIEGSDLNINLTTDRVKRATSSTGINNSTINLTVIGSRKRSAAAPSHHNIHIDASSNGAGGIGGVHNSTININLNSASSKQRKTRRKVALGDHSVLVDVSSAGADAPDGGIEDSTVHVNILPPRALSKSTGHHSIVVDSSSLGADEAAQSTTSTGDHSAVVDTSATSGASNSSSAGASGVKNSTINLTVISPKDEPAVAPIAAEPVTPSPSFDGVDAPIPSLARLTKRSTPAFEAWSSSIQRKDLAAADEDGVEEDALVAGPALQQSGFVVVRRNHNSKPAVLAARAKRA
ncbi:hypothetical protein JCM10213_007251 [Rhodosporidiobolus nylandii]